MPDQFGARFHHPSFCTLLDDDLVLVVENERTTKEFIFDKLDGDKGGELIYIGIRG